MHVPCFATVGNTSVRPAKCGLTACEAAVSCSLQRSSGACLCTCLSSGQRGPGSFCYKRTLATVACLHKTLYGFREKEEFFCLVEKGTWRGSAEKWKTETFSRAAEN